VKILIVNPIIYTSEKSPVKKVKSIKDSMIYNLALAFKKCGHEIVLIAADDYMPIEKEDYEVDIIFLKTRFKRIFKPNCIPLLCGLKKYLKRNKFDMIIGNRNNRKDGISRVFVTKILKLVIQVCFKCSITDANTPFRLMSRETLKENLKYVPRDFNLSNVILSVIYVKRGMRVKFMPITFKERQGGVNSINLRKIFKIGINALRGFIIINRSLKNI